MFPLFVLLTGFTCPGCGRMHLVPVSNGLWKGIAPCDQEFCVEIEDVAWQRALYRTLLNAETKGTH